MRRLGWMILVAVLLGTAFPLAAQESLTPVVSLSVEAGYNGLFRENEWTPLKIRVSNEGDGVAGRLVVRPETSGNAFTNTFSTPVNLPTGSRQVVFLYITARGFATQVRVELIDDSGQVIASQETPMRGVTTQDQIHVVLTQSSAGSVDLTGVHAGGFSAFQGNWLIEDLPGHVMGLEAADTLLFSDIDTGTLSAAQRTALADWVTQGGHLIVTGGANWQATASGLSDLLPLLPDASDTVDDLTTLAALANQTDELRGETIVATGALADDARALAAVGDVPLVARRIHGLGTVDYLAADPLAQPLAGWDGLNALWFSLASSVAPLPGWAEGLYDLDRATASAEILPGFDLLPNVLPLCGFLAFYVALIGPLNYVVLNRVNRREFAWLSIPLFIILFSVLAWVVGFNLRGNTATLSRLAVVESWPESDRAQVNGLVGLLSPRRTTYTLALDDSTFLRPISRNIAANPFASSVQASTNIAQGANFRAEDFLVDASFIATFAASGTMDKPAISGQASLFYDTAAQTWAVRGSVRNDSTETLNAPVILARGEPLALDEALAPGDVQAFEMALGSRPEPAAPSPLERSSGVILPRFGFQRFSQDVIASERSIIDTLGEALYSARAYTSPIGSEAAEQENRRRQFFLSSFINDHYFSTGRGDNVYLAGWSDAMPLQTNLGDAPWEAVDTTLHIVQLAVENSTAGEAVRVSTDQFTWVAQERLGITDSIAPVNTVLQPGDMVVFRFTPVPDMVLDEVNTLRLFIETPGTLRSSLPLEVWNWAAEEWSILELEATEALPSVAEITLRDAAPYLGAQNSVQMRLVSDENVSLVRYVRVGVEQTGRFSD